MPQESQSNENNKSKRRFSGRRRNYVDTFRWGFVPEEEDSGDVPPKSVTEKSKATKPDTKKSPASTFPDLLEVPEPDSAPKSKRSRLRKKTAKTAETRPKDVSKVKADGESGIKHAPKTPAGHLPKQPVPGKRPSKGSKRRAKIALPPYTAVEYDENDEDLQLPSYGRTPIPSDNELPAPKPNVRHKAPKTPASAPKSGGHKPPSATAVPVEIVSEVSSAGFRPRREQMVWDPDKLEYVPLVITKGSEPLIPKKPPKRTEVAKPHNRQEQYEKIAAKPIEKSVEKPKAERPAKSQKPLKPATPEHQQPHPKQTQEKKPESIADYQDRKPKERLHRGDSRRERPPKFVDSSKPDPADIEADVSGFAELGVSEAMLEALRMVRYLAPTPIQAGVFQKVQAGVDLMGQARTGTGKTAAFSIPIIEGVETCPPGNSPVALILVPTRELAVQVRDEAMRLAYGRDIRITACYGGKPLAKQIERLKNGIDILVGTPGRILDLMNRRALTLDSLRWVVLDEADRMLDIGFRPQIEKILKRTPEERQTLLFSATLPAPVIRLAERYMKSPEVLDFSDKSVAVETIDQYYVTVDPERKFDALVYLLKEQEPQQAIIFTRTKRGADRLARLLSNKFEKLAAIHGDLQQSERDSVMAKVRAGTVRYLVATDVVGRGIDVTGISHIINYDIPKFCDDYVHRVGRTGRMGRDGVAFTFVTVQEGSELTRIEMRIDKLLKRAELKGFESFTKPHDANATLDDDDLPEPPKPVFGKPVRKVRRAL